MDTNRWSSMVGRLEERSRRLTRRAGRWAGRVLPEWGRRLDELSATLVGDHASASEAHEVGDVELGDIELGEPELVPEAMPASAYRGMDALPELEIPGEGSLAERLEIFAESVRGATGAYAAFVADAQGLPLVSRHGSDDQIAITAALDRALAPIRESLRGSPQGSVAVEIDRSNVLQVIWVNTEIGRYVVGLVLPQSLGGELVESIRARLLPLLDESKDDAA